MTNSTDPPVQMLWVRSPINWLAYASISSFVSRGYAVHVYTYDPVLKIPDGAIRRDARDILPEEAVFEYKSGWAKGYLSGFSNWFRYVLLYQRGGWWCDCDVFPLRKFAELEDQLVFASEWEWDNPRHVNNNVIFARSAGEAIFKEAIEICERSRDEVEFAETGPRLLEMLVRKHELSDFVTDPEVFNPVQYGDIGLLASSMTRLRVMQAYRAARRARPISLSCRSAGLHAYSNLFLRAHPVADVADLPPRSVLRQLIKNGQLPLA